MFYIDYNYNVDKYLYEYDQMITDIINLNREFIDSKKWISQYIALKIGYKLSSILLISQCDRKREARYYTYIIVDLQYIIPYFLKIGKIGKPNTCDQHYYVYHKKDLIKLINE